MNIKSSISFRKLDDWEAEGCCSCCEKPATQQIIAQRYLEGYIIPLGVIAKLKLCKNPDCAIIARKKTLTSVCQQVAEFKRKLKTNKHWPVRCSRSNVDS